MKQQITVIQIHIHYKFDFIGLTQMAHGEIDRATFARDYGYRCPHEFEVSIARPAEDTDWIDKQLAGMKEAKEDVTVLLHRQESARAVAWERFRTRYPKKEASVRRQIDRWAVVVRNREVARTKVIRVFWVLRTFALLVDATLPRELPQW